MKSYMVLIFLTPLAACVNYDTAILTPTISLSSEEVSLIPDRDENLRVIPKNTEKSQENSQITKKLKISPKVSNSQIISNKGDNTEQIIDDKSKTESEPVIKKSTPKKPKDTPVADDKVNESRDEVLEALNRLEQMDVEE